MLLDYGFLLESVITGLIIGIPAAFAGIYAVRVAYCYESAMSRNHAPDAATMITALLQAFRIRASEHRYWHSQALCALLSIACASALYGLLGFSPPYVFGLVALILLLLLALIDARTGLLPDALSLPLLWLGIAGSWLGHGVALPDAVAGAVVGYGFLWLLLLLFALVCRRQAMGYGDLKLLSAIGAWVGWQALCWVLVVACCSAMCFAMWHQKSFRPKGAIPFGPFLALGGTCFLLGGSELHSLF